MGDLLLGIGLFIFEAFVVGMIFMICWPVGIVFGIALLYINVGFIIQYIEDGHLRPGRNRHH